MREFEDELRSALRRRAFGRFCQPGTVRTSSKGTHRRLRQRCGWPAAVSGRFRNTASMRAKREALLALEIAGSKFVSRKRKFLIEPRTIHE
jgi:hypothetical protein